MARKNGNHTVDLPASTGPVGVMAGARGASETKQEKTMNDKSHVAILVCPVCGADTGVALHKQLKQVLPSRMPDAEPCDTCKGVMKEGVLFIEVRDGESGADPYRTGRVWGIKEDAVRKFTKEPLLSQVLESRVAYIPQETAKQIGLPDPE